MQASDVDDATIDALRLTIGRSCAEYPFMPGD
jgi:hypothetical protein